jgi:putative transposase
MPRARRFAPAGVPFHVVNRGNDRRRLFRNRTDYRVFRSLLAEGTSRYEADVLGFCLMPNHFHLVIRPQADEALSAYMQWVTCRYACDFRSRTKTVGHGHVFQRRFWSAAIDDERQFLTVLRYVEANPVRAQLVERADEWLWSSLRDRQRGATDLLSELPVDLPSDWEHRVNVGQPDEVLARIRREITQPPGPAKRRKMSPNVIRGAGPSDRGPSDRPL